MHRYPARRAALHIAAPGVGATGVVVHLHPGDILCLRAVQRDAHLGQPVGEGEGDGLAQGGGSGGLQHVGEALGLVAEVHRPVPVGGRCVPGGESAALVDAVPVEGFKGFHRARRGIGDAVGAHFVIIIELHGQDVALLPLAGAAVRAFGDARPGLLVRLDGEGDAGYQQGIFALGQRGVRCSILVLRAGRREKDQEDRQDILQYVNPC